MHDIHGRERGGCPFRAYNDDGGTMRDDMGRSCDTRVQADAASCCQAVSVVVVWFLNSAACLSLGVLQQHIPECCDSTASACSRQALLSPRPVHGELRRFASSSFPCDGPPRLFDSVLLMCLEENLDSRDRHTGQAAWTSSTASCSIKSKAWELWICIR